MSKQPRKLLIVLEPDKHPDELIALAQKHGLPEDLSDAAVLNRIKKLWLLQKQTEIEEYRKKQPPGTVIMTLLGDEHGDTKILADSYVELEGVHELREAHWVETMERLRTSPKYNGYQLVFVERNLLSWPPARERIEAVIEEFKKDKPNIPVLLLQLGEPDITKQIAGRTGEMLDYKSGDDSLSQEAKDTRSQLSELTKRIDALETLRGSITTDEYNRLQKQVLQELADIRTEKPEHVVHNEPKKWIRTAANDADILLKYALEKDLVRYMGILIYTDLDSHIVDFVQQKWDAIDRVTGSTLLIFAFEESEHLTNRNRILAHRTILADQKKRLDFNEGVEIVSRLEDIKRSEQSIVQHIFTRNDSAEIARHLGLKQKQIPCLVIFPAINQDGLIIYSFRDDWVKTGEFTDHLKEIVDVSRSA